MSLFDFSDIGGHTKIFILKNSPTSALPYKIYAESTSKLKYIIFRIRYFTLLLNINKHIISRSLLQLLMTEHPLIYVTFEVEVGRENFSVVLLNFLTIGYALSDVYAS